MDSHDPTHDDMVRRIADGAHDGSEETHTDAAQTRKVWDATAATAAPAGNVDAAWARLESRLGLKSRRSARIVFLRMAVAASVVLAFFLIFRPGASSVSFIEAGAGDQIASTLEDGSHIELNSGSRLEWQFEEGQRVLDLTGEAFFDVASTGDPFVVRTLDAEVAVLGTRFNVVSRDGTTRVFVEEGRVRVSRDSESLELTVDEAAMTTLDGALRRDSLQSAAATAWRTGGFGFTRSTLENVVSELQRRFDVDIRIENAELASRSVTGTFPEMAAVDVLNAVCISLECQVSGTDPILIR